MTDAEEFRRYAHQVADWMADYFEQVEHYPVRSQVKPREIYDQLPAAAPQQPEDMAQILADFQSIILPGMTHWQHPSFFAYFSANNSYPSVLAEMLTATLGAQCMIWETSPAAAELEEKVLQWLQPLMGLPTGWSGVIQPTASDATLCALLTAREQRSQYAVNQHGLQGQPRYRVYGSAELHSSVEKDIKIAGLGRENYVKIPVDESFAMRPEALQAAIEADRKAGHEPLAVVAAIGTTSSCGIDPLEPISHICEREGLWLHVDAAYAGSALMLPEYHGMIRGIERADSFVFNPHKWLMTNFDCSAYYVKDRSALIRTFEILPEYLKTGVDSQVNNYRDWGVPLGRRFRALKLWFVLRSYGVEGLQAKLRQDIALTRELGQWVQNHPEFELMAPVQLGLVCLRHHPTGLDDEAALDRLNAALLQRLNDSGALYLTQTRLNGRYAIRFSIGQTHTQPEHVQRAWQRMLAEVELLSAKKTN